MKCSKCNLEKEIAKGRTFCKDCKNAYERNRKRGTTEAKEKTNKKQQDALKKKKLQKELDDKKNLNLKCKLCNIEKSITLFKSRNENNEIINECYDCESKKCTRCNEIKELVKGKWCKECKNEYERIRRSNSDIKKKLNEKEKERYHKNKEILKKTKIEFDRNDTKICTVCNQEKTLDLFHLAKSKGTIRAECKECSLNARNYYNLNKIIKKGEDFQVEENKKIENNLMTKLLYALKNKDTYKSTCLKQITGCSIDFLVGYLEGKFNEDMKWNNFGDWTITFKKSLSNFNLINVSHQKEYFHYSNIDISWNKDILTDEKEEENTDKLEIIKSQKKIKKKLCQCGKSQPNFNIPNEKKPICCSKCKTDDMIDVRNKRCICGNARPSYNLKDEPKPVCCIKCKTNDMVNIVSKMCQCGKARPSFNLPNKNTAICCVNCKSRDMIEVTSKKCTCGKRAYFNFDYEKYACFCIDCKTNEMINISAKMIYPHPIETNNNVSITMC